MRFLCYENIKVIDKNPILNKYDVGNDRTHMVERFRPLCFFRPFAPQNRPKGDDSDHFKNHWSNAYDFAG